MIPSEAARIVRELHDLVWSAGDLSAVDRLVAPQYGIHSDPGDPWEGQTLDRAAYRTQITYSRTVFPDLKFTIHDIFAAKRRVFPPASSRCRPIAHVNGGLLTENGRR
jgi:hypothetical protein